MVALPDTVPPNQGFLPNAPLFPPQASEMARDIDLLFFATLGVTVFFSAVIAILLFYFMVRYKRKSPTQVGEDLHGNTMLLEAAWIIVPLVIALGIFAWGAKIYFAAARPPSDAKQFYVVGKQWMWKIEHPNGKREINELHVPRGEAVKLKMTSEDVVHSFFIPAMRVKNDVVPGRYSTLWFKADTTGTFHLFCSQYCGAEHSRMVGRVVVMEPAEYEQWINGANTGAAAAPSGETLFTSKACDTCHRTDSTARAPNLAGIFNNPVALEGGASAVADEAYIRESILNPTAKVAAGYQPIMPTYRGQLNEDEIIQLIRYIQTLKNTTSTGPAPMATGPAITPMGTAPAAGSATPAGSAVPAGSTVPPTNQLSNPTDKAPRRVPAEAPKNRQEGAR